MSVFISMEDVLWAARVAPVPEHEGHYYPVGSTAAESLGGAPGVHRGPPDATGRAPLFMTPAALERALVDTPQDMALAMMRDARQLMLLCALRETAYNGAFYRAVRQLRVFSEHEMQQGLRLLYRMFVSRLEHDARLLAGNVCQSGAPDPVLWAQMLAWYGGNQGKVDLLYRRGKQLLAREQ
jgi:hypothetical protein